MNILVLGSGGREHAICWKLKQSVLVKHLYCAPGNAGTAFDAVNVDLDILDNNAIVDFCKENSIDLVVVGPEKPLAIGIVDVLEKSNINVFGPSKSASQMESSKVFAKNLMAKYNIPTGDFELFNDYNKAKLYLEKVCYPIVIKASGLAQGKGVIIVEDKDIALKTIEDIFVNRIFGNAGDEVVIEQYLEGEEVSILVVTDGEKVIPLSTSQDHKQIFDGDKGPNTGGMGAYSPTSVINSDMLDKIMEQIVYPTVKGLKNEGIGYKGVLYVGIMLTNSGPKVLEYNVRFGDPETQVILPRLKSDFADILMQVAKGKILVESLEWKDNKCVCVVLSSLGYPGKYESNKKIIGLESVVNSGGLVFHAGTCFDNGQFFSKGGRVLNVVGEGSDIKKAINNVYSFVEKITFENMYYRKDIGFKELKRK